MTFPKRIFQKMRALRIQILGAAISAGDHNALKAELPLRGESLARGPPRVVEVGKRREPEGGKSWQ
jgi:hypothetical protein